MKVTRLRAFTILELTISMLLSAIVIGIAYFAYDITAKSYNAYVLNNQDMVMLIQLNHLMLMDIHNSDDITRTSEGIIITDSLRTVEYKFNPNYIVRISTIIDTFKIGNQQLMCTFAGHSVETTENPKENLVDEVSFIFVNKGEALPFHYSKQYSAVELIKRTPYANN